MMKLFVHRVLLDYTQDPLPPCVRMWNFSTCRFEQHLKYLSSLIRNILQAWKLFVLLIIYPNWVQKGMFFSPTSLSLSLSVFFLACMYVYVCACACLGCIVVVLWNVAIRSAACYSGPLNGTIATHCCSSQSSVFSLPYFGFWDLIHIPFDVIIRSWPKITDDWPGMIHPQYDPLHAYTLLCFEIVHKFCHSFWIYH